MCPTRNILENYLSSSLEVSAASDEDSGKEYANANDRKKYRQYWPFFSSDPEGSYWILETDYHNYSVVYSCTVAPLISTPFYFDIFTWFLHECEFQDFLFGAIKLEFAWILAREKHLDPEMVRIDFEDDHGLGWTEKSGSDYMIWGWLPWENDNPQLEHATNVLVENGIDITPLEDTVQNEDCVYEWNIWQKPFL